MKKWIALLLALVLCIGLCACNASDENGSTPGTTEGSSMESTGTESTAETGSTESSEAPTDGTEEATQTTEAPTEAPTEEATGAGKEPETTDPVYTKVSISSAADISEGVYLLGGASTYSIDDGSTYGFVSGTFDSKGTRLTCAVLTVNGNTVSTVDKTLAWNLIKANGGFYVQNMGSGRYLYYGSSEGNAIYATAKQSEAGVWKVVAHDGVWTLEEVASGRQLSVNAFGSAGSKYLGAAAYGSTGSTARSLELYVLTSGTVVPNEPVEEPAQEPTEEPTEKPTEAPTEAPTEKPTEAPVTGGNGEVTYILNTSSKKYHDPDCGSVKKMSEKNKEETTLSKEELEAMGYKPCGTCKP